MTDSENFDVATVELEAMRSAYRALAPLDEAGRHRALRWLFEVLDVGVHMRMPLPPS
ncbi:hypothetical protein [Nocardia sp. NPDC051832]|uniref:hypothetical protein n=1 Tax=Nocardia sp. NPDC051832 TaxID=3155673 RepID=UPI0034170700